MECVEEGEECRESLGGAVEKDWLDSWNANYRQAGRTAGRQGELGAAFGARDWTLLSFHPLHCRTGPGIVASTTECHASSLSATQTQWHPSTPEHRRGGGVANKRPKDVL